MLLALCGDTMLGRGVGEHLRADPGTPLVGDRLAEIVHAADATILNLECCISERGAPWPERVFHFRAPPQAVDVLVGLGVRAVTLANNHAMDFGPAALLDTVDLLEAAGIAVAGAGATLARARAPQRIDVGAESLVLLSLTDHPVEYAAGPGHPGVAWADLRSGVPTWVTEAVSCAAQGGAFALVSPHWGPNMVDAPVDHVRRSASALLAAGADLVAGHSAHVFHGIQGRVLFDLGDFIDYAIGPLRNDLGVLWLIEVEHGRALRVEAVPLRLRYCRTDVAVGPDARWVCDRLRAACAELGTPVVVAEGRVRVELAGPG